MNNQLRRALDTLKLEAVIKLLDQNAVDMMHEPFIMKKVLTHRRVLVTLAFSIVGILGGAYLVIYSQPRGGDAFYYGLALVVLNILLFVVLVLVRPIFSIELSRAWRKVITDIYGSKPSNSTKSIHYFLELEEYIIGRMYRENPTEQYRAYMQIVSTGYFWNTEPVELKGASRLLTLKPGQYTLVNVYPYDASVIGPAYRMLFNGIEINLKFLNLFTSIVEKAHKYTLEWKKSNLSFDQTRLDMRHVVLHDFFFQELALENLFKSIASIEGSRSSSDIRRVIPSSTHDRNPEIVSLIETLTLLYSSKSMADFIVIMDSMFMIRSDDTEDHAVADSRSELIEEA